MKIVTCHHQSPSIIVCVINKYGVSNFMSCEAKQAVEIEKLNKTMV